MTRFVVDADVVLYLLKEDVTVSEEHQLVAPALIRSEVLATLYSAARRGDMSEADALDLNERFSKMKMRLLGDAVLRRVAWKLAAQLDWESTYPAEYVALTQLQADAYVTRDEKLARSLNGVVETAGIDALL